MQVREAGPEELPMALLLEADPSAAKVAGYLHRSRCFLATLQGAVVGCYVLLPISDDVLELMNISIAPEFQSQGFGTRLLRHAIDTARGAGAHRLELGTGTFGDQLVLYQRAGFRPTGLVRDFFVTSYPEPVFEDGLQHRDMLRFELALREDPEQAR